MALIMNATNEVQHVVVFGNHFTLKPGQVRNFQDNIAHFMALDKREQGLVSLPDEFEDPTYVGTEEGKKRFTEIRAAGVANRCRFLKQIIYNNQVALRQDLEKKNEKVDPRIYASDGEINAMQELLKYQDNEEDSQQKKIEQIKELEKKLSARK